MLNLDNIIEPDEIFTIKLIYKANQVETSQNEIFSFIYKSVEKRLGSRSAAKASIELLVDRPYWKNNNYNEAVIWLTLFDECSPDELFENVIGLKEKELYYGYSINDEMQSPRLIEELIINLENHAFIYWIYVFNGGQELGFELDPHDWVQAADSMVKEANDLEFDPDEELLPLTIVDFNLGFVDEQGVVWSKGPSFDNHKEIYQWDLWLPPLVRPSMKEYSPDGIHMTVDSSGEPI
jgi:hypothetical protein